MLTWAMIYWTAGSVSFAAFFYLLWKLCMEEDDYDETYIE